MKFLEDSIGSADGFVRAFNKLVPQNRQNKKCIIFGFGKVGVGIARELKNMGHDVTIIDQSSKAIKNAVRLGYGGYHLSQHELIITELNAASYIVTATGCKGFISRLYKKQLFNNKILINIGAEDEFGDSFNENEVLNAKMPVNFVLDEPTKIEYLDPVYYAHNICIDLLIKQNLAPGVYPLPKSIDKSILDQWFCYHREDNKKFYNGMRDQYGHIA